MKRFQPNTVLMNSPFGGLEQNKLTEVYFIGIGGIGMSALAKYFHSRGVRVSGYDKTATVLTQGLEESGIPVHYEENIDRIPKQAQLVVYTPAIPAEHEELIFYRQNGNRLMKRSEVLEEITASSFNICIAGTHGKTTITTMIAHLLRDSGFGCNAFLGGISVNYDTNFWSSEKNVCVVEADEYDRSFLRLSPDIAVITAMDPDHLDIYGTAGSMEQAFIEFSHRVKKDGLLVSQFGLKRGKELAKEGHITYSLQNESADVFAREIRMTNGSYEFNVQVGDKMTGDMVLNMGGMHNVENAIAAIAVASSLGIDNDRIRLAIGSFRGVKRRFEYVVKNNRIVFIDDYAHHPEELKAVINGARTLFREKKCTVIFQPHLYSRTRDLADGFAASLDLADEVVVLPVYPAREEPIAGVNSEMILAKMKNENKKVLDKEELLTWMERNYAMNINKEFGAVLISAGAGDIDMLVEPIAKILKEV
jgi:UDP-N-acetylmuramate--alanine ligase